ncbi:MULTISPECIES: hypothetical protein [Chryseobacterium]|uniref:hypothetical protein n=1 Tax=Chryseobacterium TaxID=59732 RepID=UPI00162557CA|nr:MULTISPECIES: hypothetical protein [Chryseobacterium]MDM1553619.1 hypothetical protein [Chryseobacterium indologenes]
MKLKDKIYCTCISVYPNQLTKRKSYIIEEIDSNNVRICNDENKLKWYSKFNFSLNNEAEIISIHIDEEILYEESDTVEVTIEFSNNDKYWVVFTTPKYLDEALNEEPFYSVSKYIVVKRINEQSIRTAIYKLDEQNELIENCRKYK